MTQQLISVLDATGTPVTVPVLPVTGTTTAANSLPVVLATDGNALPVINSGTTGVDHSVNPSAFPLASYVLLETVASNINRAVIGVQNQSTDVLQLVRDNGAGGQTTVLLLDPANGAVFQGAPGASWVSNTFKGRLRVYGTSAAQVAIYED